jgi:hypothetical protein
MANVQELYDRFKGGGKGAKMVYPLENQSDYLGKITFHPIDEKKAVIPDSVGNLVDLGKDLIEMSYDATLGRAVDWLNSVRDPNNLDLESGSSDNKLGGEYSGSVNKLYKDVKKQFEGSSDIVPSTAFDESSLDLIPGKKISLYLPRAIQIQDTVSYDNAFQLGLIGGAVEQGMAAGAGIIGTVGGVVAGQAKAVGSMLGGDTSAMNRDAAGIIAGRVAARIPGGYGDAIAGAVRSATRLTTNPNTRALFKDVPIRNFSFAFQLVPTSRAEARMIETIIKTFREELYPEALTAAGVNIGYRFPNRFLVKVKYNNTDIEGIRFLPVYMQSFNATYNSATGGMHNDGRFTAVDISMAFTETRAIAKADIKKGY